MHLDEEQVQRLLHGELPRATETSAREHLARCADCRQRVAEGKRDEDEVYALLRAVDVPPPAIDAEAVAARARAHDFGLKRWAAGILLALCIGGAAYAVPGSPLPALVGAVVEWMGGRPESPPTTTSPEAPPDASIAGIAVVPGEGLLIQFTSAQTEGVAHVSLTDGAEVVVRAPIGAATFSSDADRLVIDNAGSSATFEIQIPRAAPRVEVRVSGNRIFLKEGPRVTTGASGLADALGPFHLPLTPSGS